MTISPPTPAPQGGTSFLSRLLPSTGLFCAARMLPTGGFAHQFFSAPAELLNHLVAMDTLGHTMYLAQASFAQESQDNWAYNQALPRGADKSLRRRERTKPLTIALRSFFIDIDAGEEKFAKTPTKAYPSQAEAIVDLKRFCAEAGFPLPSVVNSGNGLYAHWVIDRDVPSTQWRVLAGLFKDVLTAYGFRQDPSRTSDESSVLRPVGTHNRKSSQLKLVRIVHEAPSLSLDDFVARLEAAAKAKKVQTKVLLPPEYKGINDEFTAGLEGPPSDPVRVAAKCPQVKAFMDAEGNVSEPEWYNMIGLLRYCEGGEAAIHGWSAGHPDYSVDATDDKIRHHIDSGAGPTTCAKIAAENPHGCMGCPAHGKVKSPIVLGRPEVEQMESIPDEEACLTPTGYLRAEDGVYTVIEGVQTKFHDCDLYPIRVAMDKSLGYETVTIRHQLPVTREYHEFTIRSALLFDQKTMLMTLMDNHVQVAIQEKNTMTGYLASYMQKLRAKRNLSTLHSQMGWKPDGLDQAFVLGEKTYKMDGSEEETGFARNIPEVAKAFHAEGHLEKWADATEVLGLPGMEPFAFAFLAGAFGAPLMRFTGYAGAMVALVGPTGLGKTLIGEWVLSTYGDPRGLILMKNDTQNALVSRLGLYGSLPLYLDEISNIEGQDLSDLLYRVTQGRDKARLGRDSREKAILNSWNTLAVASSNHSLLDKLASLKADASAEMNRVMEVYCRRVDAFDRTVATRSYRVFQENFGVAGPPYLKYLAIHQTAHRAKLDALTKMIDTASGATSDERFWSAMSAVAIYGGTIAKKLGIIKFDVQPVLAWLTERIKLMRKDKEASIASQVDVLGQFLDEHSAGVMVTSGDEKAVPSIIREPRGPLVARIMVDKQILLISRAALRAYLDKHYGSYSELRNDLHDLGALLSADGKRVLGGGTFVGGVQQPVWVIDLKCPALGRTTLASVSSISKNHVAASN